MIATKPPSAWPPQSTTAPHPPLVRHYLARALPAGGPAPRGVRIAQTGEMWLKPGGRALRFSAVEEFAVEKVEFTWRARVRVAPLVSIRVVDGYAAGQGFLDARLFGMPLARARGQETAEGEVMRYLAELAWVPHAMRFNPELEWREIDEDIVEVVAQAPIRQRLPSGSGSTSPATSWRRSPTGLGSRARRSW